MVWRKGLEDKGETSKSLQFLPEIQILITALSQHTQGPPQTSGLGGRARELGPAQTGMLRGPGLYYRLPGKATSPREACTQVPSF